MWYRRFTQRGKIDTFQLFIKRKSPSSQLPFLHHRAQRGRDYGSR